MSYEDNMTAKIKYLAKEYRLTLSIWCESDARLNRIIYEDCVAEYTATEKLFMVHEYAVWRRYDLVNVIPMDPEPPESQSELED